MASPDIGCTVLRVWQTQHQVRLAASRESAQEVERPPIYLRKIHDAIIMMGIVFVALLVHGRDAVCRTRLYIPRSAAMR